MEFNADVQTDARIPADPDSYNEFMCDMPYLYRNCGRTLPNMGKSSGGQVSSLRKVCLFL